MTNKEIARRLNNILAEAEEKGRKSEVDEAEYIKAQVLLLISELRGEEGKCSSSCSETVD